MTEVLPAQLLAWTQLCRRQLYLNLLNGIRVGYVGKKGTECKQVSAFDYGTGSPLAWTILAQGDWQCLSDLTGNLLWL